MNTVRKAMSAIKGGRLAAAAAPARLVTYGISDVPGDDPGTIGSGPTVRDGRGAKDALAILDRYAIALEPRVVQAIEANEGAASGADMGAFHMLATPMMALEAAAAEARRLGLDPVIWGDAIEGEASVVGRDHAGRVLSARPDRPTLFLSGGETTVTVGPGSAGGRGGRNSEYLLALALALDGHPGIAALACDTDGIDGSEDNAGAWFDPALPEQARAAGIDLAARLAAHDAYTPFAALDRLVVTGPTFTNVNDFRAILVRPGAENEDGRRPGRRRPAPVLGVCFESMLRRSTGSPRPRLGPRQAAGSRCWSSGTARAGGSRRVVQRAPISSAACTASVISSPCWKP